MTALRLKRAAFLVLLFLVPAVTAFAQNVKPGPTPLKEESILMMFGIGIGTIAVTWTLIPWIFARQNQLDDLIDILKKGTLMRFVTVTYIVIVVVTLAIIDRLDGDKVSTLLASIAGYVLGQTTRSNDETREEREARHAAKTTSPGSPTHPGTRANPSA
jgi:hypothetical protein